MTLVFFFLVMVLTVEVTIAVALYKSSDVSSSGWRWLWLLVPVLCLLPGVTGYSAWHPTSGPYIVGSVYPFGDFLQSTLVSVGVNWLAYGLLLFAGIVAAWQLRNRWFKTALWGSGFLVLAPSFIRLVARWVRSTANGISTHEVVHHTNVSLLSRISPLAAGVTIAVLALVVGVVVAVARSVGGGAWTIRHWLFLTVGGVSLLIALNYMLVWTPTPGPYSGTLTPFGVPEQEALVDFAFTSAAIWLLYLVGIVVAPRIRTPWLQRALLAAGMLVWVPHLAIIVALYGFGHGLNR